MKLRTCWKIYKVVAIGVGTYTLLKMEPVRNALFGLITAQGKKAFKK